MAENREYKSDVFSMLMEYKENALDVFNALNGTAYDDPSIVEIKTLEKGISLSVRNDAAFIIGMNLNIYEHQSTYNPNMPIRALIYVTDIIHNILDKRDLYSYHKITIPEPKFVVFYNGLIDRPEREILRLSDLFEHVVDKPELELMCTVYNINPGNNIDLVSKSTVIEEYSQFVDKVREYYNNDEEKYVSKAVDYCIENHILEDFLTMRRQEVIKNMTIDMTFETREKLIREEEQMYGRKEGINDLFNIAMDLKSGKTYNELLEEGVDEYILDKAKMIIQ